MDENKLWPVMCSDGVHNPAGSCNIIVIRLHVGQVMEPRFIVVRVFVFKGLGLGPIDSIHRPVFLSGSFPGFSLNI
jgi:hypothetical protein